jgi:acetyl-CoA carboxylase biotin carboxyl carrier protein
MSSSKRTVDQQLIRDLAALLMDTGLTEIEVEQDDLRIRVARSLSAAPAQTVAVAAPAPVAAREPEAETKAVDPAKHPGVIPSPMVGTCYHAPAPGAKPFVAIGDTVKAGQTVMIVEAMKTMNQIAAPRAGKVTAILAADATPVEYGEPLLIVE